MIKKCNVVLKNAVKICNLKIYFNIGEMLANLSKNNVIFVRQNFSE
jgi:hypothetical protein